MLWGERRGQGIIVAVNATDEDAPMPQPNDPGLRRGRQALSRSLAALDQDSTLIAVIEISQSSGLVAGIVPGIDRQPLKKLSAEPTALLALLDRWRAEATKAGRVIARMAVAYEAGRDGFWLARWLQRQGIEAHVIHPTSVAVSREHRRAKTDRLDTELLKRAFLGWLRGETRHCSMARIPTLEEEETKRPNRERENLVSERTRIVKRMKSALARLGIRGFKPTLRQAPERLARLLTPEGAPLPPNTLAELQRDMARLRFIMEQIREIEATRAARIEQHPDQANHAMILLLARVIGVGIETADMLVHQILSRPLRDRKAVARYAGLTGSPDESGARRREKGLAKPAPGSEQGAGNARVRRGMIQLAWRFLMFQKQSALVQWYQRQTAEARGGTRKTMIVALTRNLLIALWRLVTTGEIPEGVVLRRAA
jgi:transposase